VGHDPEESAEDERGDAERLISVYDTSQPVSEARVVLGILPVRVNEDVNVEQPDGGSP
jgi:hypothetical protein